MSLEDIKSQIESAPTSVIGGAGGGVDLANTWEPDNIICAGTNNEIINGRRCSIINGSFNTIGGGLDADALHVKRNLGKFNTHILGANQLANSSIDDNAFYVGNNLDNRFDSSIGLGYDVLIGRSVFVEGDVFAYYSSDSRFKDNIISISNRSASQLNPVSFTWKGSGLSDIGLIAQQAEKIFPEIVKERKNGFLGIHYYKLVTALIVSIKERQQKINKLKSVLNSLKK